MFEDDPTFAEAATLTGLKEPALHALAVGPFAAAEDRLPFGALYGITILVILESRALSADLSTQIAVAAAREARPDGNRLLMLCHSCGQPTLTWLAADDSRLAGMLAGMLAPALFIPADRILATLAEDLAAIRTTPGDAAPAPASAATVH